MYESEFIKLSASSLSNQGGVESHVLLGLPLLMEVPGVAWMAITDADLRDYAAMYLTNPSGGWTSHKFESPPRASPGRSGNRGGGHASSPVGMASAAGGQRARATD